MYTFTGDWFQIGAVLLIPFMIGYLVGRIATKGDYR